MRSFVLLLKSCAQERDLQLGRTLHADIARRGHLHTSVFVGSALINMYAKCGAIAAAREVFDMLPLKNAILWTSLIAGYTQLGRGEEALACFDEMLGNGLSPDEATYASVFTACGSVGAIAKGQELHAQIDKDELPRKHVVIGTAIVDMYAKCGLLESAQKVFDELRFRNVISWTALITGYAQHDYGAKALHFFQQMQREGLSPNESTFPCILKACGMVGDLSKGCQVHTDIVKRGLLERDIVIANSLVDMYAKCGDLTKALAVFNDLRSSDVVSWSILINGYTDHAHDEQALCCYEFMKLKGLSPNTITCVCILKACSTLGAYRKGQELHNMIMLRSYVENDPIVGNALLDMYAACGLLAEARLVFDILRFRDMISWNSLLAGYGQLGVDDSVFKFFDRMVSEGNQADDFSFTIVLNSCCHRGLINEGQKFFEIMSTYYDIIPDREHHACIIDLFGRAGDLDKAIVVSEEMPFLASLSVWHNMLGACQKWGNKDVGRRAFEYALQLDDFNPAAYVYMSNVCAATGSHSRK